MVDIPRCKYLKIYFCLGEIEMKVQFCTACKDYWNGHKKVIFFFVSELAKISAGTDTICQFHFVYGGEKEKHASKLVFYIFFLLSNCPKFKVKKRYGRPWKSKYAHVVVVVVPFLRNLRVAYHKFFISITTTYLHSGKILKKRSVTFVQIQLFQTRFLR